MWRLFITTFGLVFLAELGDKTQLTTMIMAAKSETLWPVFLGSALALILSSLIGVLIGTAVSNFVPEAYLRTGAGAAFMVIGFLLIIGKF